MENNKKIPKTLDECTQQNSTVKNLHLWADRLEVWGNRLFFILIVVGIISTVVDVVSLIDYEEELIFPTLVSSVITWALYAFLEYCAYHALSLLISALALITQNTIITANVALFESSKNSTTTENSQPTPQTGARSITPPVWNLGGKKSPLPPRSKGKKRCWACNTEQDAGNDTCLNCGETL